MGGKGKGKDEPPSSRQTEMMRGLVLFCAVAGVSAEATELTEANWKTEVVDSGKAAFVKFLAPW